MKKKYSQILKESLINFDGIQKTSGTVEDIVNFKGKGELSTHKKASNVVSVLEDMYYKEDNDLCTVKEGDETEIASGEGPATKIHDDAAEQKVSDLNRADGVAHANPADKNEFKDTIVDAKTDDKELATESADGDEDDVEDDEDKDDVEESLFEEGDADIDSEPVGENLENEPDHEAQGDDNNGRDTEIGTGAASLDNNPDGSDLGDEEIDGMEEDSEGLPATVEGDEDLMGEMDEEMMEDDDLDGDDLDDEEAPEAEEMDEMDDDLDTLPADAEDEDDLEDVPQSDTDAEPMGAVTAGDEEPDGGDEIEQIDAQISALQNKKAELTDGNDEVDEMYEEDEDDMGGGGDVDVDDGMDDDVEETDDSDEDDIGGDSDPEEAPVELGDAEDDLEETDDSDEDDIGGDSDPEEAPEDDLEEADEADLARIPGEEDEEVAPEEAPEEGEGEEAAPEEDEEEEPVLDLDRESTEESIVERLIREMQLEEDTDYSDLDMMDSDDIED